MTLREEKEAVLHLILSCVRCCSVHSSEEHEPEQAIPVSNALENMQDGSQVQLVQKLDPQEPVSMELMALLQQKRPHLA